MKKIPNKSATVSVPKGNGTTETIEVSKKYSELVIECINNPPKEGFTLIEMQQRNKILKIAQKANGEMQFEDADFEKLRSCVKEMRWLFISEGIIEFAETIILQKNGKA